VRIMAGQHDWPVPSILGDTGLLAIFRRGVRATL
jgi:hypothetical protein